MNRKEYDSTLVARYLWAYAKDKDVVMNITKLQKLLYTLYGIYLAYTNERLTEEHPHAWPYGPVFPRVRKDFIANDDYRNLTLQDPQFDEVKKDSKLSECVEATIKYFGKFSATELVGWTHNEDSPWTQAKEREGFQWNDLLDDDDIKTFFNGICKWK